MKKEILKSELKKNLLYKLSNYIVWLPLAIAVISSKSYLSGQGRFDLLIGGIVGTLILRGIRKLIIHVKYDKIIPDPIRGDDMTIKMVLSKNQLGKKIKIEGHEIDIEEDAKVGDCTIIKGKGKKGKYGGENGDLVYEIMSIK